MLLNQHLFLLTYLINTVIKLMRFNLVYNNLNKMSKITGTYKYEREDNFIEYLKAAGLTEEQAKAVNEERTLVHVKLDGNKVIWKSEGRKNTEVTLIDGVEVEEVMGETDICMSTLKIEGNSLIIMGRDKLGRPGGDVRRVYNFSDSGINSEVTCLATGMKGRRFYKRVK